MSKGQHLEDKTSIFLNSKFGKRSMERCCGQPTGSHVLFYVYYTIMIFYIN